MTMELTQEAFDKMSSELEMLKTEAENKGGALVEKNKSLKDMKEQLKGFQTAESEREAKKAEDKEKELIKKGEEKKLLEQYKEQLTGLKSQLEELSPYKERVETMETQALEKKQGQYNELAERLKDVLPQKENILNAFGDNLDAKIAYLEDLDSSGSQEGFKTTPQKPGKTGESTSKFEEAKTKGDISSMIANAPEK